MVFIDSNCRLEVPQHDISTKKDARRFQVAAACHSRLDRESFRGTDARSGQA